MFGKLIVKIDNVLYRTFGIVSPLRKAFWRRSANNIQRKLDIEHSKRDFVNRHGYNYTTKQAVEIYDSL